MTKFAAQERWLSVEEISEHLIACFDDDMSKVFVKKLTEPVPLRFVFKNTGLATDALKINIEQILIQLSPSTEVKSI